ncbi:MAG: thymidine phosphorylase [Candidatus Levybacteria bacterium]|nr:thymidine phosphorylase [Candidatus Levybacteria bacterium]
MDKEENNSPEKLNRVLEAIRKKLVGKHLNYQEIYAIMDAIANNSLGDILTTYFAASGYAEGFSNSELYYLTRAMVETGEKLDFNKKIVADKHSIGGVPGTRTTLVVVPIVAACGFIIPKSSSRAITSPDGTADDMEVIAPVNLSKEKIYSVVKRTNGCIVWGGSFGIAPADDIIINVEKPLLFESYDKILVSIMAKKIAFGSNHVVIDLPYGKTVKVHTLKDAKIIKNKFEFLAREFNIKIKVLLSKTEEPAGRGIGPILETRDALRILQQKPDRPLDLEEKSINLAGHLLELCLSDSSDETKENVRKNYGDTFSWARKILENGLAFLKMQGIIKAQGGNSEIDSEDLKPGKFVYHVKANKNGIVKNISIKNLTIVAKLLGAPKEKGAGVFLDKKIGEKADKDDVICTLYSEKVYNLKEGKKYFTRFPIIKI